MSFREVMIQRDWMLWFGAAGGSCGGMMGACLGRKGKNATREIIAHHNFKIIGIIISKLSCGESGGGKNSFGKNSGKKRLTLRLSWD